MPTDQPFDSAHQPPSAAGHGTPPGGATPYGFGDQPSPPKKKRNVGCIIALVLLGIFFVLLLVCCGGLIQAMRGVENNMTEAPEEVRQRGDQLLKLDPPESFEPELATKFGFLGVFAMDMVLFIDRDSESTMVLIGYGGWLGQRMQDDLNSRQTVEQSRGLIPQTQDDQRYEGLTQETHSKDVEVLGKTVTAQVVEFSNAENELKRLQVVAVVPTEAQPVVVLFDVDADTYTEEELLTVIETAEPPSSAR